MRGGTTTEWLDDKSGDVNPIKYATDVGKFATMILKSYTFENTINSTFISEVKRIIDSIESRFKDGSNSSKAKLFIGEIPIPANVTSAVKDIMDYSYTRLQLLDEIPAIRYLMQKGTPDQIASVMEKFYQATRLHTKLRLDKLICGRSLEIEAGNFAAYNYVVFIPIGSLFYKKDTEVGAGLRYQFANRGSAFNKLSVYIKNSFCKTLPDNLVAALLHEFKHCYDKQNGVIDRGGFIGAIDEATYRKTLREASADHGAAMAFERKFDSHRKLISDFVLNALRKFRKDYQLAGNNPNVIVNDV